jgi:hypothetical protein
MDEIELLVAETFKHFHEHFEPVKEKNNLPLPIMGEEHELPSSPGLLYHIQKTSSVFVVRTYVSKSIRADYQLIIDRPEDFPSLRLLEGGNDEVEKKLRYFMVEDFAEAEVIHDQVSNRRFPVNEELMCNLSDPGFSWWLSKKANGFQISFNISLASDDVVKLGPLGDQQLALRVFQEMQDILAEAGLDLNVQNEINRVQFSDGEEFLLEELRDLFEFGVLGEGLEKLFKLLSRRISEHSRLEALWYFLQEIAAMRRFWIQVQYDLDPSV